jgi:hypothetical protein
MTPTGDAVGPLWQAASDGPVATDWGYLMFKLKDAGEHGGPPRPLFTKSGMETSTSGAY